MSYPPRPSVHAPWWADGAAGRRRRVSAPPRGRVDRSGVDAAGQLGGLRLALVPGLLQDRRDIGVGHEALPALLVPVERDPDAIGLGGVAKHRRALGSVLSALLGAGGGEHFEEAVEVFDLGGYEQQGVV